MAGLTPLPPTLLHTSTRLTHSQAHTLLSSFLDRAENDAAYRPDSALSERGPQSASTGSTPNLTLHHLKRILQGIEGKKIGGEDVGRFFGDGAREAGLNSGLPRTETGKRKRDVDGEELGMGSSQSQTFGKLARQQIMEEDQHSDADHNDEGNEIEEVGIAVANEADDWQDKDDYQLAQREGAAELIDEEKQPGIGLKQPTNEKEAKGLVSVGIEGTNKQVDTRQGKVVDKESKKQAKKDRRKEDKKSRQEARMKK